ncbi:MAG: bifunctional phosphoribosyl-AMP cyclohydrolase/phosphoribosyl-ATP diphosphatase HisIE [Cardiobacteriaceae bacterium]|nr:bifunctional phosphoribosyl-AMP cyclohydrolase/phosphoribosyl-ATP diphosphatase HisIE [Cardiobacteriaceae bacterium]
MSNAKWLDAVKFNADGLVSVIAVDWQDKTVLMQAFANREALLKSLAHGQMFYYSRSRQKLWKKGEESGHFQNIKAMYLDCDGDCVLAEVEQVGNIACHTGHKSCFYRKLHIASDFIDWQETEKALKKPSEIYRHTDAHTVSANMSTTNASSSEENKENFLSVLHKLEKIIAIRKKLGDTEKSYTAKLLGENIDKLLKKIGEEATETVIAACHGEKSEIIYESCDLLYHLMVLWSRENISLAEIENELARRFQMSGLEEKASRNNK